MSGKATVDAWFTKKKHPLEAEMQRIREIVLSTHEGITEDIKWSAPTFMYKGNIASFFPNAKKHVSLMFHEGAQLDDGKGFLEGEGGTSRVARFVDMKDIEKKKAALQRAVKAWIKAKDAK